MNRPNLSRRHFGKVLGLGGVSLALVGCKASSTSGTTTATLDVTKVETYAKAGISLATTLAATPTVLQLLGTEKTATVTSLLAKLQTDLASFTAAAGTSVSLTVNSTSALSLAQSLLSDLETLLALATPVVALIPAGTVATSIGLAISAASTIAQLFSTALAVFSVSVSAPVGVPVTTMTEAQALAVLGVQ